MQVVFNMGILFPYKILFLLFNVSLIFPTYVSLHVNTPVRLLKRFITLLNAIISITLLLMTWYLLLSLSNAHEPKPVLLMITGLFGALLTIIFRLLLNMRYHRQQQIANIFDGKNTRKRLILSYWIIGWAINWTFMQVFNISFYTVNTISHLKDRIFFGNKFTGSNLILLSVTSSIFQNLLLMVPFNTFAIFYVIICHHAKQKVQAFTKICAMSVRLNMTDYWNRTTN